MKTYNVDSLQGVEPIVFALHCADGYDEVFHVPRKPRPSVVAMLVNSSYLDEQGIRRYPDNALRQALLLMLAKELWDPDAQRFDDAGVELEGKGAWVACNDQDRYLTLIDSNRFDVSSQRLGDIVWDVVEEVTGHPMTAPKPL